MVFHLPPAVPGGSANGATDLPHAAACPQLAEADMSPKKAGPGRELGATLEVNHEETASRLSRGLLCVLIVELMVRDLQHHRCAASNIYCQRLSQTSWL